MEVLINTRRYTLVHDFCFFKWFPIGCIGLILGVMVSAFLAISYGWERANSLAPIRNSTSELK